jgi:DNA-binding phage protein
LGGQLVADAPVGVAEAQALARALRAALDDAEASVSEVARLAGVDRSVIYDMLAGRAYASVLTLSRLERALGCQLWGPYPPAS